MWEDDCRRAARRDSTAAEVDRDHGFEPEVDPILLHQEPGALGLAAVAGVAVRPIEVQLAHGQKQAGTLADECPGAQEHCH